MGKEKRHCLLILTIPLLLVLLFPLLVENSSSPQEVRQSREQVALAPDDTLPFDPREVVKQSSSTEVIDPLVSSYTPIAVASDVQREPRVAYNSTDNTYLVVWEDNRSGTYQIYGQRVDADGSLLGSNFNLHASSYDCRYPDVAYSSTSNIWLVVWQYDTNGAGFWNILCKGVNSDGTKFPVGAPLSPRH